MERIKKMLLGGIRWTVLGLMTVVTVYPFIWILISSFKSSREIFIDSWGLPAKWEFSNYAAAWTLGGLGSAFLASVVITILSTALILILSAMIAYVIARVPSRFNQALYYFVMAGMLFPVFMVITPLYLTVYNLSLAGSFLGLGLVYVAFSIPFSTFVLVGFFKTMPSELEEAALVDGCSMQRVFWQIMLPLVKPGLTLVAVFNIRSLWNEYELALVLLAQKDGVRTLPITLANLFATQTYRANWGAMFAGIVIVVLPLFFMYAVFQENFKAALTEGAVKG